MAGNFGVIPVDRQQVLRQVITPNTKEINLFTALIDDEHHRWHLQHDAKRDLLVEGDLLAAQLLFCFRKFLFHP